VIRAIRGWSFFNPHPMHVQRQQGWRCDCNYRRVYLHSPVYGELHWPGPFMKNTGPTSFRYLDPISRMGRLKGSPDGNTGNFGGFYSYRPEYADNMGRWDEIDVIGIVRLFYDVAIHEFGYRSDGILIEALWVLEPFGWRLRPEKIRQQLEDTYECFVHLLPRDQCQGFKRWILREDFKTIIEQGFQDDVGKLVREKLGQG